jgi:hypothetical protein
MRRLFILIMTVGLFFGTMTAAHAEKRFSVECGPSHTAQEDPIVSPGRTSMHMHQFFGNKSTGRNSTYTSMVGQPTTCGLKQDTAAYWVPTLLDSRTHKPIPALRVLAYYRSISALSNEVVHPYPKDLRMISDDFEWLCKDTQAFAKRTNCSGGQTMGLRIIFPSCWDGKHTDSPNHMSHMAHQTGSGCPASHPVAVPRLALNFRWKTSDATHTILSSELMGMGPHADFWNTWNQDALTKLTDHCLGRGVSHMCGLQTDGHNSI